MIRRPCRIGNAGASSLVFGRMRQILGRRRRYKRWKGRVDRGLRGLWLPILVLVVLGVWFSDPDDPIMPRQTITLANIEVVDGDTIRRLGEPIRLIGFDAPETYRAQCDGELKRGNEATKRLQELLRDAGTIQLVEQSQRDRYGRILARLILDEQDVADIMVNDGLARRYSSGQRLSWCS